MNVTARCAAAAVLFALAGCVAPSGPAPTETASTAPTVAATTSGPSTSAHPPPASVSSSASTSSHTTSRATTSAPPRQQTATTTTTTAARLTAARIIDGDTIVTSDGDTVRLAGIDTPERGQCGYSEATRNLRQLLAGQDITLTKAGLTDRDKYGRLIRYVDVGEQDAGMGQIMGGFARARYDSRDGYGRHPRQDDYVAADAATPSICAASSTTQGAESTATKTAAAPAASATATREETGPPETGKTTPYANCTEVREAGAAPLHRGDPGYSERLDRDGDGTACE